MRFHLIDRIDAWEPGATVRARKVTSRCEDYWDETDGGPVMPPPLLLEALCQAATWLVMITTDRQRRAALLSVGEVEWLDVVRPADVVDLECEITSMGDRSAVVSGVARVEDRPVLVAQDVMCALIDAGDLADLDDTERLQVMLTRREAS